MCIIIIIFHISPQKTNLRAFDKRVLQDVFESCRKSEMFIYALDLSN